MVIVVIVIILRQFCPRGKGAMRSVTCQHQPVSHGHTTTPKTKCPTVFGIPTKKRVENKTRTIISEYLSCWSVQPVFWKAIGSTTVGELRNVFSDFETLLHSLHTHLQILSRDKWAVGDENSLPLSTPSLQTPDSEQHERPFSVASQCCPVSHEIFAQLRMALDSKTYVSHKTSLKNN